MDVTIGVVAHESRLERAETLILGLQAEAAYVDDGTLGCAGNHQVVLRQMDDPNTEWRVVLEDDAVPVHGFRGHVRRALAHAPAPVVGFYLGTGNPSGEVQIQIRQAVVAAKERRLAWIVGDCLIGSVGYAVHDGFCDEMLDYIWDRDEELPLRISRWAQARGVEVCYTCPSLVDHDDTDTVDGPAVRSERRAWAFGVPGNWDTPSVRLGHCPKWSAE